MGSKNPFKDSQQSHFLTKKLLPWALYSLVPIIFIRLYLYPIPLAQSRFSQEDFQATPIISSTSSENDFQASPNPVQTSQQDFQTTPIVSNPSETRNEDFQATPIITTNISETASQEVLPTIPTSNASQTSQGDIQTKPIGSNSSQEDRQVTPITTTSFNITETIQEAFQAAPITTTSSNITETSQETFQATPTTTTTSFNISETVQENFQANISDSSQDDLQATLSSNASETIQDDLQANPITTNSSETGPEVFPTIPITTTAYLTPSHESQEDLQNTPITTTTTAAASSPVQEERLITNESPCDYFNGKWVQDKLGPLYNGTTCSTIKDGQNCISHGRPDFGFLYWRWEPKQCKLPRFNSTTFLELHKNKHIAFIGDSMARNQMESLLCLLSTVSLPDLVYTSGEDNKFRRWNLPSHNINVSIYWSPFLVKGIEKNAEFNYNKLFFDSVDEKWANDMDQFDVIVLSIGHWFLHPAVYYDKEVLLGCHYCPDLNYTQIGFYDVFRKAFNTTLKAITDRRGNNAVDVILTTFSPAHFEGEWDKAGACPKKEPLKEGEKNLEWMDAEMRKIGVEEIEKAKENAAGLTKLRFQALDVTSLSNMRPDSHPGPYMNPFPFANGVTDRVQNDCVHWCLPGAIDTWNEIMLEVIKRWEGQSSRVS
ncbi:Xyloglucan O-acetyltransferase 1 [Ranunculus cassubicifolius]